MKDFDEIRKDSRVTVRETFYDGMRGWVTIRGVTFVFVASNGGGWDHVSVSHGKRCPTWEEMCVVKDIFFRRDECCVEYHPAEKDYVNVHPNCLHIWKLQNLEMPKPPKNFV